MGRPSWSRLQFIRNRVQYSLHVGWRGHMSSPKSRLLVLVQSCQVGCAVLCTLTPCSLLLIATRAWNPLTRDLLRWALDV